MVEADEQRKTRPSTAPRLRIQARNGHGLGHLSAKMQSIMRVNSRNCTVHDVVTKDPCVQGPAAPRRARTAAQRLGLRPSTAQPQRLPQKPARSARRPATAGATLRKAEASRPSTAKSRCSRIDMGPPTSSAVPPASVLALRVHRKEEQLDADRQELAESKLDKAVTIANLKRADANVAKAWALKDATTEAKEKADWDWAVAHQKMVAASEMWEQADQEHRKCLKAKEEWVNKLGHAEAEERRARNDYKKQDFVDADLKAKEALKKMQSTQKAILTAKSHGLTANAVGNAHTQLIQSSKHLRKKAVELQVQLTGSELPVMVEVESSSGAWFAGTEEDQAAAELEKEAKYEEAVLELQEVKKEEAPCLRLLKECVKALDGKEASARLSELGVQLLDSASELRKVRMLRAEARAAAVNVAASERISKVRTEAEADCNLAIQEIQSQADEAIEAAKAATEEAAQQQELDDFDTQKLVDAAVSAAQEAWVERIYSITKVSKDTMAAAVLAVLKPERAAAEAKSRNILVNAASVPTAAALESLSQEMHAVAQAAQRVEDDNQLMTVQHLEAEAENVAVQAEMTNKQVELSLKEAEERRSKSLRRIKWAQENSKLADDAIKEAAKHLNQCRINKTNAVALESRLRQKLDEATNKMDSAHAARKNSGNIATECGFEKRRACGRAHRATWNVKASELIASKARAEKEAAANEMVLNIKPKPETTEELLHPKYGESPNVWWRSPTMDELRAEPNFVALPPTDDICLGKFGARAHRYCRQGTRMFEDLCQGTVGMNSLLAMLGFREPAAGKRLALKSSTADHNVALRAAQQLKQSRHGLVSRCTLHGEGPQGHFAPFPDWVRYTDKEACGRNRISTIQANASMRQVPLDTPPPPTSAYCHQSTDAQPSTQQRVPLHKPSLALVLQLWQVNQLPAGLYAVMHLWPWSTIYECGLSTLERSAIPVGWTDVTADDLPILVSHPHGRVRNRRPLCGGCSQDELLHISSACPFIQADLGGFHFKHTQPSDSVHPCDMPWIQLQLFIEDCSRMNVANVSATRGLRLLCVSRDDVYVRLLLRLLAKFNRTYVKSNNPPPVDFFFDNSEYQVFLRQTLDLCAQTGLNAPKPQAIKRVGGVGEPFFADGSVTLHNEYRTEALPRRMKFNERTHLKSKS